jgi:hypothetical protein
MKRLNVCSVEGCGRFGKYRLYCNMHYLRMYRHGDPHHVGSPYRFPPGPPPIPHTELPAYFRLGTPEEHERFHNLITKRIAAYHWPHSALYLASHADDMRQEQDEVAAA